MKKILFFILLLSGGTASGQSVGRLRYDTTVMEKVGGNNEFVLRNSTRGVIGGVLTNQGNGRTIFALPAPSGLSGGNLGAGFRIYSPVSQGNYTLFNGYAALWDSTTNANGLTLKIDTSLIRTVANSYTKAQVDANIAAHTFQRALIAGSTLTQNNTIAGGGFNLSTTGVKILTESVTDSIVQQVAGVTKVAIKDSFRVYGPRVYTGREIQYKTSSSFLKNVRSAAGKSLVSFLFNEPVKQYIVFMYDPDDAFHVNNVGADGIDRLTFGARRFLTSVADSALFRLMYRTDRTDPAFELPSRGGYIYYNDSLKTVRMNTAFGYTSWRSFVANLSGRAVDTMYMNGSNDSLVYNLSGSFLGDTRYAVKFPTGGGGGMTNPMTTTGDIIYSSSGSTPARRGIGSTGDVLTVSGGVPAWVAPVSGVAQSAITDTLQNYWRVTGNATGATGILGTTNAQALDIRANNVSRISMPSTVTASDMIFGNGTYPAIPPAYRFRYYNASAASRGLVLDDIGNGLSVRLSAHTGNKMLLATGAGAVGGIEMGTWTNPNNGSIFTAGTSGNWYFSGGATSSRLGWQSSPTASLHLAAGIVTAGYAPLKFTSGPLLTSAEAGAVEFLTDKVYATITTGAARKEITLNDAALTSGTVPVATTNGRLTDGLIMAAGNYTPTITNSTNISSSTLGSARYQRVGNIVDVTVTITITATASATNTVFRLTLPIASNLAANSDLAGYGSEDRGNGSAVQGLNLTDDAQMSYTSTTTSPIVVILTFKYTVL